MKQEDVKDIVLNELYVAYFQGRNSVNMHAICEELGMDTTAFWNIVDYMSQEGLIKAHTMGGNYIIRSFGIIRAEEIGIAPEEIREENQQVRTIVLDSLAAIREERGSLASKHIQSLSEELGVGVEVLANNLQVLDDLGYVEPMATGSYKITLSGLKAVQEWRERINLAEEFERISSLKPHPRGRALQKLLSRIIEKDGWLQEEGVRTFHEEMDVIVHKEREYFLIECKWEKERVQAAVVRELYGKLSNRIGVQGVLVSMSGFTSGAVKQAEDYASDRVILFFGEKDIHRLVYGRASFDALLNEKYQQLITQRKITCS